MGMGGRVGAAVLLSVVAACDIAAPEESAPTPSPTPTSEVLLLPDPREHWLLPNMRSIAATDLQVERVGTARRLRFAAALANVGDGPMLVVPRRGAPCPPGQIRVRQAVHVDGNRDGVFQRRRDSEVRIRRGGCMLAHPTHDHWHFDAMAAYSLDVPGTPLRVSRDKVSFCLRDNERVPGFPRVVRRSYFGDCTARTHQGISPGWVDIYRADLDGQWLRLPRGIGRRTACLTLRADPQGLLAEIDETDNAISIPIRIVGDRVRRLRTGC